MRADPPGDGTTIPELLLQWAERTPDSPALISPEGVSLTYAQLLARTRAIAGWLGHEGATTGDCVAISLPNGLDMAVSFLGVASCAAAAPLNPALRTRELAFCLDDLAPRILIADTSQDSPAVNVARARGITVVDPASLPVERHGSGNATAPQDGDVALLLHTSGTTSQPKLVPLTHRNLTTSAGNIARTLQLDGLDRCLNVMPLFHIHGIVGALLSSLAAGGSVLCGPGYVAPSFLGWLTQFRPTWYTAVPAVHQSVMQRARSAGTVDHSLRLIRSSSAPMPRQLAPELEKFFGVPVIDSYGMTEAAHQIASNPLPPAPRKAGSVGFPTGTEVTVAPDGEILIRGASVTAGYAAPRSANEEQFSDGWFRTGDVGLLDEDGYLFITGRKKEMINRGGEKISPLEVEEVLLEHPSVAEAVVFAIPHEGLGEDVGAAVVFHAGKPADPADLRRFAAARLADFKIPRRIHVLTELPRGATGKINRTAMPAMFPADGVTAPPIAREESPPDDELALIWKEVLGVDTVSGSDDFFSLGGDSILATTMFVRATRELDVDLPFVDFMEQPTLSRLSALLRSARTSRVRPAPQPREWLVAIQPRGTLPPIFCVPPMDGSLLGFSRLSLLLGNSQPLWAFAPPHLDSRRTTYSIGEIAAAYVAALRSFLTEGPYQLLGDCFGGIVAYEMTSQLLADGDDVTLLAMVDAFFNSGVVRRMTSGAFRRLRLRHGMARIRYQAGRILQLRGSARVNYLRERFAANRRHARFAALQKIYDEAVQLARPLPDEVRDARFANVHAERTYQPASLPVGFRATFMRTGAPSAAFYPVRLMGWEGFLPEQTEVLELPGDHDSRFNPPALDEIARHLRAATLASR